MFGVNGGRGGFDGLEKRVCSFEEEHRWTGILMIDGSGGRGLLCSLSSHRSSEDGSCVAAVVVDWQDVPLN